MTYKPGDKVVVHKPSGSNVIDVLWVDLMDKYDGIVTTIRDVKYSSSGKYCKAFLVGCENYFFFGEWLSLLYEDEYEENISPENLELMFGE